MQIDAITCAIDTIQPLNLPLKGQCIRISLLASSYPTLQTNTVYHQKVGVTTYVIKNKEMPNHPPSSFLLKCATALIELLLRESSIKLFCFVDPLLGS